jgi:hypothetical protein
MNSDIFCDDECRTPREQVMWKTEIYRNACLELQIHRIRFIALLLAISTDRQGMVKSRRMKVSTAFHHLKREIIITESSNQA